VHPVVDSTRQVVGVVAFLITVAAGAHDYAVVGVHEMPCNTLENAVILQLIHPGGKVSEVGGGRRRELKQKTPMCLNGFVHACLEHAIRMLGTNGSKKGTPVC
jgi:hypothetical protein